jgi:hypothetical protein
LALLSLFLDQVLIAKKRSSSRKYQPKTVFLGHSYKRGKNNIGSHQKLDKHDSTPK